MIHQMYRADTNLPLQELLQQTSSHQPGWPRTAYWSPTSRALTFRRVLLCSMLGLLSRGAAATTAFQDRLVYAEGVRCCQVARRRLGPDPVSECIIDKCNEKTSETTNDGESQMYHKYLCVSHAKQAEKYRAKHAAYWGTNTEQYKNLMPVFKWGRSAYASKYSLRNSRWRCTAASCTCWWGKHDQCIAAAVEYHKPGSLHVTGAGSPEVNGWYRRMPARYGDKYMSRTMGIWATKRQWRKCQQGRVWFEKDDGGYVHWGWPGKVWRVHRPATGIYVEGITTRSDPLYCVKSEAALPPPEGWKTCGKGKSPLPQIRVVT